MELWKLCQGPAQICSRLLEISGLCIILLMCWAHTVKLIFSIWQSNNYVLNNYLIESAVLSLMPKIKAFF